VRLDLAVAVAADEVLVVDAELAAIVAVLPRLTWQGDDPVDRVVSQSTMTGTT
jgi:hypothetical protein